MRFGDSNRDSLGIAADDPNPNVAKALSLLNGGAVIKTVAPGSPAERSRLKRSDIATDIGTRMVLGSGFLRHRPALLRGGEIAELAVLRDGMALTVRATIAPIESRAIEMTVGHVCANASPVGPTGVQKSGLLACGRGTRPCPK